MLPYKITNKTKFEVLLTFGVLQISTITFVATTLVLELILDNSDMLSGLARGASPSQSSWIKSTFGIRFRLRLLVIEGGSSC